MDRHFVYSVILLLAVTVTQHKVASQGFPFGAGPMGPFGGGPFGGPGMPFMPPSPFGMRDQFGPSQFGRAGGQQFDNFGNSLPGATTFGRRGGLNTQFNTVAGATAGRGIADTIGQTGSLPRSSLLGGLGPNNNQIAFTNPLNGEMVSVMPNQVADNIVQARRQTQRGFNNNALRLNVDLSQQPGPGFQGAPGPNPFGANPGSPFGAPGNPFGRGAANSAIFQQTQGITPQGLNANQGMFPSPPGFPPGMMPPGFPGPTGPFGAFGQQQQQQQVGQFNAFGQQQQQQQAGQFGQFGQQQQQQQGATLPNLGPFNNVFAPQPGTDNQGVQIDGLPRLPGQNEGQARNNSSNLGQGQVMRATISQPIAANNLRVNNRILRQDNLQSFNSMQTPNNVQFLGQTVGNNALNQQGPGSLTPAGGAFLNTNAAAQAGMTNQITGVQTAIPGAMNRQFTNILRGNGGTQQTFSQQGTQQLNIMPQVPNTFAQQVPGQLLAGQQQQQLNAFGAAQFPGAPSMQQQNFRNQGLQAQIDANTQSLADNSIQTTQLNTLQGAGTQVNNQIVDIRQPNAGITRNNQQQQSNQLVSTGPEEVVDWSLFNERMSDWQSNGVPRSAFSSEDQRRIAQLLGGDPVVQNMGTGSGNAIADNLAVQGTAVNQVDPLQTMLLNEGAAGGRRTGMAGAPLSLNSLNLNNFDRGLSAGAGTNQFGAQG